MCHPPVPFDSFAAKRLILTTTAPRRCWPKTGIWMWAAAVVLLLTGCGGAGAATNTAPPTVPGTNGTGSNATNSDNGSTGTTSSNTGTGGTSDSGTASAGSTSGSGSSSSNNSNSSSNSSQNSAANSGSTPSATPPPPPPVDPGTVISNIQTASGNWRSWAQLPPYSVDCSAPCAGVTFSMNYGVTSPSLSNNATQFNLSGTAPYADALFSAQLMGQNSPQLRDANHALLPTLHNFTYDADFYVTNASITQVLEFDISMYMNGVGMIWGNQCNHLGDGDWDIWDNVNAHWVSAGVPCKFTNGWNHVTIQLQRQSNNALLYQSIELNGTTYSLNISYPASTAPSNWWGVTANYQMDGNSKESANTTYLDNFSVTYK